MIRLKGHWNKTITDKVVDDYYRILKAYSDKDIIDATYAYIDTKAERFPTPGILKGFIPHRLNNSVKDIDFKSDISPGERKQRFQDLQHYIKTGEKADWMEV